MRKNCLGFENMKFIMKIFKFTFKKVFFLIAIILIVVLYAYYIEPNLFLVEQKTIELRCLKSDISDKKLVQISDLHFTKDTSSSKINNIHKTIANQNPLIVFITGDFISNDAGIDKSVELVKKISEKYPTYIVFGNWDYWALDYSVNNFKDQLEKAGGKVLINDSENIKIGDEDIGIAGVKDPYTSGEIKNDIDKALIKIEDNKCRILLAHSPNVIKEAVEKNIDLVLVGHTHGGQVYIPYLTEKLIPANRKYGKGYIKGLYKTNNTQMYVNRGIGTSVVPFRFIVPPEITVFSLTRQ